VTSRQGLAGRLGPDRCGGSLAFWTVRRALRFGQSIRATRVSARSMRLELDGRQAGIRFSASHLIPGHPKCGRLHGHSYSISLILAGEKGEKGMVIDFLPIKEALREIADEFDHRVILPGNSRQLELNMGKEVEAKAAGKRYVFPAEDVVVIDAEESSAEEMARVVLEMLVQRMAMPENVSQVEIGVYEELGQGAWASKKLR